MARGIDLSELSVNDLLEVIEMSFERLGASELLLIRDSAEAKRREKLEAEKNVILAEMRGRLEGIGLTLDDVLPSRTGRQGGRSTRRTAHPVASVKYRSPQGEWSGRGRVPQWLQQLEAEGHNREEFLIKPEANNP